MRVNPGSVGDTYVTSGLRESVEIFLWFLPGLILWVALGTALSGRLAAALQTRRWVVLLLFVSSGLIVGATLSPATVVLESGAATSGQCDFSRLGVVSPSELVGDFDAVVNILLFITLGFGLGLLPRTRRNLLIVLSAFSLTFVIEATQALAPELGRGCESADMIDNTVGLLLGLVAGYIATAIAVRRSADRNEDPT